MGFDSRQQPFDDEIVPFLGIFWCPEACGPSRQPHRGRFRRYQIRNALKARNASGDTAPVNFSPFEAAYQALTDKLRPQVFTLGFLRQAKARRPSRSRQASFQQ